MNPVLDARAGREPISNETGKSRLLAGTQGCQVDCCEFPALVTLGQVPLCLKHFIVRCYEWLDDLEPQIQGRAFEQTDLRRAQSMVEECSGRALLISLRCESLSNLDRSRLLDILLLSSDLLFQLRAPGGPFCALFPPRARVRSGKEFADGKSAATAG